MEAKGVQSAALSKAKKLLKQSPDYISQDITVPNIGWSTPKDRSKMDKERIKVLKVLEQLEM